MTDTYNDSTGSRKKFLIPLVVLLLCAVSLTGAGYAYNTSVTTTGSADSHSFDVDLYDDEGSSILVPINVADVGITVTTEKTITNGEKSIRGVLNFDGPVVLFEGSFKVAVDGAPTVTKCDVDATGALDVSTSKTKFTDLAATTEFKVYTDRSGDAPGAYTYTGEVADFNGLDVNKTYYVVLTLTAVTAGNVSSTVAADLVADDYAEALLNSLHLTYTVTVEADPAA